jgi:hypothetical protein
VTGEAPTLQAPPPPQTHKIAYGITFMVFSKVYSRRSRPKGKLAQTSSHLSTTGHINSKKNKASRSKAEIRAVGISLGSMPETAEGVKRRPRLKMLLDGQNS